MRNNFLIVALIALVSLPYALIAQENGLFHLWPDTTLAKASSAKDIDYMSEEEKQVVFYINVCRVNPRLFSETYLSDYLNANSIKKDKVVKGLMEELKIAEPSEMLQPSIELTNMARAHAKDMGETGRTGHNSSTGQDFKQRAAGVSKTFRGMNENANYGNEKALDIVVDLLIDRNVPNAGHRKNILDKEMRFIGVAIEPHKRYGHNCVQDFGGPRT